MSQSPDPSRSSTGAHTPARACTWTRLRAAETQPLRQAVLRPHQRVGEIQFPGDDAPQTLHAGALEDGVLVSVATICREAPPGETDPVRWRLRGMATTPAARRRGHGAALVAVCLEHAARHGGRAVWCNARVPARVFYERLGFRVQGAPFEIPQIGPHLRMVRALP